MRKSLMSLFAKREHKAAARILGYALTLDTETAWWGLRASLQYRLEAHERAALAFMALKSLDPEHAALTVELALYGLEQMEAAA
ncbi:hypothetical protein [Marivita sp.]|uniref:hypothetical protein n=1 Tax=Marivita sp. TaxID=2003365 RepID=UPI003F729385